MSKDKNNNVGRSKDEIKEINFNGAAILDEQGREVAIAEEMIDSAYKHVTKTIIKSYQQK